MEQYLEFLQGDIMNSPEKIIADLYNHHKTSKDRMNNIEKQVEDLQSAQKAIHERNSNWI